MSDTRGPRRGARAALARARERRDRPPHAQNSRSPPPRERQPLDGPRQQLLGRGGQPRTRLAKRLAAGHDAGTHGTGRLTGRRRKLGGPGARQRHHEIEAVEERARQLVAVAVELLGRAGTGRPRVAAPAARAQVHRPDEREAGRVEPAAAHAGDRDRPVLDRLAKRLENRARELGKLVEHEHAAMGERHLARSRAGPPRRRSPPPRLCGGAPGRAVCGSGPSRAAARLRPSGSA